LTIADDSGRQVRRLELTSRQVCAGLRGTCARILRGAEGGRGSAGSPRAGCGGDAPGAQRFAAADRWERPSSLGAYTATLGRLAGDKVTPFSAAQTFHVAQVPQ
jgi:hypothetical protein